jgi:hypothetical protein
MSLPPDFSTHVREALQLWRQDPLHGSPLAYMALVQRAQAGGANIRQATNQVLLDGLEAMAMEHADAAHLLRQRFLDNVMVYTIANQRNQADVTIYRLQREALRLLVKTLAEMEADLRSARRQGLETRLEPPTYTQLIGVEEHLSQLLATLQTPGHPYFVLITGMGGLGKTALADASVRQVIRRQLFADIGWVSARQQRFDFAGQIAAVERPALTPDALVETLADQMLPQAPRLPTVERALAELTAHLAQKPSLIVVDNLETLVDVEALLPTLRQLAHANASKFLLTARRSLFDQPDLFHLPVPELSQANALQLVRWEARLRNLPDLATAADADLLPIYSAVGGNPLALRLIVGQCHVLGLDAILADLSAARGQTIENLYTYLYRWAWERLDETARLVLLAMPLTTAHGGTLDYLAQISGLPPVELRSALVRLVGLNLVDSRGGLHERRYTIHNLTRSFLHEQVARWQSNLEAPQL